MLNWLKERHNRGRTAQELYGTIVAQARQPAFYTALGMPDTARGRFELIALHVAVILRRLQSEGPAGAELGRTLSETFVVDMDDNMREMSFSDLAVPREIKKAAAALYDRHRLLSDLPAATADAPDPLADRLTSALTYLARDRAALSVDAAALARYLHAALAATEAQPAAALLEAGPRWPAIQA